MKYPEPLAHLISFIPDDVYADKEKEITEIAEGIDYPGDGGQPVHSVPKCKLLPVEEEEE